MPLGRFICLEGIEGVGKTTQIDFIAHYVKKVLHQPVFTTREPGGTPLAESIRRLILEAPSYQEGIASETELLLLFAARRQHILQVIQPALSVGDWVVCDRFTEASYAYQGGGRGISVDFIHALESYIHQDLRIDRVILLDLPVSVALDRLRERNHYHHQSLDRIERESPEFFERVRYSYLQRAAAFPDCYRIINANCSLEQVQFQIMTVLDELLRLDRE